MKNLRRFAVKNLHREENNKTLAPKSLESTHTTKAAMITNESVVLDAFMLMLQPPPVRPLGMSVPYRFTKASAGLL